MQSSAQPNVNVVFDASFLDVYTGGDREIRDQVLNLFLDQAQLLLKRLKDAQGDERAWHEAAHSLKGCASGVGANALAAIAREAEKEAASSTDAQAAMIEELAAAFKAAAGQVRLLLQPIKL